MKKIRLQYYLFFPFFWLLFQSYPTEPTALSVPFNPTPPCGTNLFPTDSESVEQLAKIDAAWAKYAANHADFDVSKSTPYQVPIVFHIIHENGIENLSASQIQTVLDQLNDAFAARGIYDVIDGTDTHISFCLAQRTPDNQPSTGIERIQSPLTDMEIPTDGRSVKNLSRYAADQYLNIWVVSEIRSEIYGDGLTGYSSLPTSHGNNYDGIVIEAGALRTTIGTWVLIHEVGHYLGLYHTFRRGCSNDNCLEDGDQICDTPPDNSTATIPCSGYMNSCDTDTNSGWDFDSNDDTRNHMDYGNLECFDRFSPQQGQRMQFTLENIRQSIANSPGCLQPCNAPVTADFQPVTDPIYAGETVSFQNNSTNATNYEWLLDGQLISREADLETFFFATGNYELTLVAYSDDPSSCRENRKTQMITVQCSTEADFTYVPTTPLPSETVFFQNNSSNADSYEWYIDGELISTEADASFIIPAVGEYVVELRASSDYCIKTTAQILQVGELQPVEPAVQGVGMPIWLWTGLNQQIDFRNNEAITNVGFNVDRYSSVAFDNCGDIAFYIKFVPNGDQNSLIQLYDKDFNEVFSTEELNVSGAAKTLLIPFPTFPNRWYLIYNSVVNRANIDLNTLLYSVIEKKGTAINLIAKDVPIRDLHDLDITGARYSTVGIHPVSSQLFQLLVVGLDKFTSVQGDLVLHQLEIKDDGIKAAQKVHLNGNFSFENLGSITFNEIQISPSGEYIILLRENGFSNTIPKIELLPYNDLADITHINVNDLHIIPLNESDGLNYVGTVSEIAANPALSLNHLQSIANGVFDVEFSPNSKYLYIVGGQKITFQDDIPGFIGQIDFLNEEPTLRLQIDNTFYEYNSATEQYQPSSQVHDNQERRLEKITNSFDGRMLIQGYGNGRIYRLSTPNTPLKQSLIPQPLNLNNGTQSNIALEYDSDLGILIFPNQIDGYNYLNFTETPFLLTRTNCEQECQAGGMIYLQFEGQNIDSFDLIQCPTLVSTCLKDNVLYDLYDPQTNILLEKALSGGRANYPPGGRHFNFLDRFSCGEICDNELDDDGDGLVDCFDDDCCGDGNCANFYASEHCAQEGCRIELSPQEEELSFRVEMANDYSSSGDIISFSGAPVVGDIDGDGFNEIVISPHPILIDASQEYFSILETEEEPYALKKITTPVYSNSTQLAIADLDRNGRSEILLHTATSPRNDREWNGISLIDRIVAYEVTDDGEYAIKWVSTERLRNFSPPINEISSGQTVGVADFNQDGIPEVYSGDNVVIQTANGSWMPILNELNHNQAGDFFGNVRSVAADVLPVSADCLGCSGLELVIGNLVIAFDIDRSLGEAINVQVISLPNVEKGWTSIADVDADGDLDALISTFHPVFPTEPGGKLTYWDIQNPEETSKVVFSENNSNRIATQPVIGDMTGDDRPEIAIQQNNEIVIYRYNAGFEEVWRVPFQPNRGVYPMVLFDFNADQKIDIITQTSLTKLEILNGINGASLYEFPLTNSYYAKLPLVADIDRDGETEILLTSLTSFGSINVLESNHDQVIPLARPIWNQRNWHNTQIADDLTVPLESQAGHLLPVNTGLNSFGAMHSQYQPPVSDMTIEVLDANCIFDANGTNLELKICNQGELSFPANGTLNARWQYQTDIGDWKDIEAPELGTTMLINQVVAEGECIIHPFSFSALPVQNFLNQDIQLRLVAGVNVHYEFGAHTNTDNISTIDLLMFRRDYDFFIPECNFTNNTDTVNFGLIKYLNLPADTLVCANESITLNAGSGFLEYLWNDGSRDSILSANSKGIFWVTVIDSCHFLQTDTIRVDYQPSTILDLGDTLTSCDNAPITIQMDNFIASQWFPNTYLDCDTCTTVIIQPDTEIEYIVVGETSDGCYSVDTLQILKANSVETLIDTFICIGTTLFYENEELQPNQTYEYLYETVSSCDSTVYLNVMESDHAPYYENIDIYVCENDTTYVENSPFAAGDTAVFQYQTIAGCDSILTYHFLSKPTRETTETRMLCAGESTVVFGNDINETGIYSETFTAANSCDSTHYVKVEVLEPLAINLQTNAPCPSETDGEIIAQVSGGLPPYKYNWSNGINNQPQISNLSDGDFSLTVTDDNGCESQISTTLDYFATFNFSIQKTDITCFAATDGSIEIIANKDLEISLDGENYNPQTTFQNLAGGDYILFVRDENSCLLSEPFTIHEPDELIVEVPFQQELQMGDSIQLSATTNSARDLIYKWQPTIGLSCTDCPNPIARPLSNITYELQVIDNQGCTAYAQTKFVVNEQVPIYIPTAFSPNDDGRNDYWEVFPGIGVERIISINIFNRWGGEVFKWKAEILPNETMTSSAKWDGMTRGQAAATGVYVYSIEVEYVDGRREVLRGDFLLLR